MPVHENRILMAQKLLKQKLLKIATVTAAHGMAGEVRLKVFLEETQAFARLGPFVDISGTAIGPLDIRGQARSQTKNQFIARIAGSNTREAAEALKGLNLFIPRSRLPDLQEEDTFYYADLIGLKVLEDGKEIGTIKSIRDHGAGDLVEIEFLTGKSDGFVFSCSNFPSVRIDEGFVVFNCPSEVMSQDEDGKVH